VPQHALLQLRWSPLAAILAASTLLALILVNLITLRGINSARPVIIHTRQSQDALARVRAALADAESAQRGFLLTGDGAFLEPMQQAEESLSTSLSEIMRVGTEDAMQQRLSELERLASARMEEIRRTIELYQSDPTAALALFRGRGDSGMEEVRRVIDEVRSEETRRLADPALKARRNLDLAIWIDVGAALGLLVLAAIVLAIDRDIARRKVLEAALRESAQFQEQFVGVLGHDLRNPLSAISMATDLLLRLGPPPSQANVLWRIASSAARMDRMVVQLLDLTRARLAGGIPLDLKPGTNLAQIAAAAVEELRIVHPRALVNLDVPRELTGDWDPDRMAQVVSNIVGNAIQHGAGADVEVRVRSANASAILEVHNSGPPIPPDLLPRIFEPFRRGAKTGARQAHGLGLGLFIAQQIVLGHGGKIDVRSTEAEGTTFTVALPSEAGQRSAAATVGGASVQGAGARLLPGRSAL
jgi:signal transduction histidine kinase